MRTDLALCLVTTSPGVASEIETAVTSVGSLRMSSVLDSTADLTASLRRDPPDVVILDLATCAPLFEKVMSAVSRLPRRPHVVVLTARTNLAEREALLSSGVAFVFTKFRPLAELGPVIRRLGHAGSGPEGPSGPIKSGAGLHAAYAAPAART